tara:strand:+ start:4081 stop:5409 length:1329 start_codon:yes stop_codon:yes gene_type:complete
MSSTISPEIQSIATLFASDLVIPDYQRPYRWNEHNVAQLIVDIKSNYLISGAEYRLGTVVLHTATSGNKLEIVDGQQRTITLCILLTAIATKLNITDKPALLTTIVITHPESQQQVRHNSAFINMQLEQMDEQELINLYTFILSNCSLVVIKLSDISEAFQFFDSQNARGKALEPHDLLKAYHLREMGHETQQTKLNTIKHWEQEATSSGNLKPIFANYLYRIRRWLKGEHGRYFTNKHIDVFKGVNLSNKEVPHYIETALRAHIYTTQYNHSVDRIVDKNELKYPHQIGQIILNGSRFFEFVAHYIEQQKYLEKHTELAPYLKSYNGSHRAGDNYARNLFLAVVMLYHDKFKEHHFKQAIRLCFCWAYKLRVENSRVLMASIDNYAKNSSSLLNVIAHALDANEVLRYVIIKNEEAVSSNKTKGLEALHGLYLGKDTNNEQ